MPALLPGFMKKPCDVPTRKKPNALSGSPLATSVRSLLATDAPPVAEIALGKFVGQFEGLFERERIAFDLNAGQRFADFGCASDFLDPLGLEADGGEEAAGSLDGF